MFSYISHRSLCEIKGGFLLVEWGNCFSRISLVGENIFPTYTNCNVRNCKFLNNFRKRRNLKRNWVFFFFEREKNDDLSNQN